MVYFIKKTNFKKVIVDTKFNKRKLKKLLKTKIKLW